MIELLTAQNIELLMTQINALMVELILSQTKALMM